MNPVPPVEPLGKLTSRWVGLRPGLLSYSFVAGGARPAPLEVTATLTSFMDRNEGGLQPRDCVDADMPLTDRQLECLGWISKGKSSTDIGAILNISGRTVDYHVGEICRRLDVRTRTQAVAYALQKGWLRD